MTPIWETLAKELDGEVVVAKVDVPANQDLGRRFGINGFPTIKFLSKGAQYTFKGKRTVSDFKEFVRGGYKKVKTESISPPKGVFQELIDIYTSSARQATKDVKQGKYFTVDILLTFMPFLFLVIIVLLLMIPTPVTTTAPVLREVAGAVPPRPPAPAEPVESHPKAD